MAMTVAGMKAAILAEMATQLGGAEDPSKRDKYATAMATAIVDYIKANATVTMANGGVDSDGHTLVTNSGTVS